MCLQHIVYGLNKSCKASVGQLDDHSLRDAIETVENVPDSSRGEGTAGTGLEQNENQERHLPARSPPPTIAHKSTRNVNN